MSTNLPTYTGLAKPKTSNQWQPFGDVFTHEKYACIMLTRAAFRRACELGAGDNMDDWEFAAGRVIAEE